MAYYPGRKVEHKGPSRISLAKVLIVMGIAATVYIAVTLIPPWWRYYRSSSVMTEGTQKAYSTQRQHHTWPQLQSRIDTQVRRELLVVLKIPPSDLRLEVDRRGHEILVNASWKAVAKWPIVGKTTTMRFKKEIQFSTR